MKTCNECEGPLVFLGALGARYVVRCRNCGISASVTNAEANAIIYSEEEVEA